MFGLLSDLDEHIWEDSPVKPPHNKTEMANGTYNPWGLVKNESIGADSIKYWLNSNSGAPNQGILLGTKRNPLKSVGHCWMTFEKKEPGNVITGIAIEDDWVIMKKEHLQTLGEAIEEEEEKHKELLRGMTIDMGVYGDLIHGKWEKKGKPPRGKGKLGYHFYEVVRCEDHCDGKEMKVFLSADDGTQRSVEIRETARNPFHALSKAFLKIVDGCIVGIMVEDDWVERSEAQ